MLKLTGAIVLTLSLTACAGSSGNDEKVDASVCADALDEAARGFTALSEQVRQVQAALDAAFDGDLTTANRQLDEAAAAGRSPATYKRLEAQCREAVQ